MKISEVTVQDIKDFCRIDAEGEERLLTAMLDAGKNFILSQTGLTEAECDEKEDLTLALLMLCSDFYDNRTYSLETGKIASVNPAVDAIISQYCMNIL